MPSASDASDSSPEPHPLIVAIDGPAGAGKSTVAAHLARRFGLLNLETGAMYRALALKAVEQGTPVDDAAAVTTLTETTRIVLEPGNNGNRVLLDGRDVTALLRDPAVTAAASRVSVHPKVRHWMVTAQRAMGQAAPSGVVMEGRDIGTVVFPNATVKIFLDASVEARGGRRFLQTAGSAVAEDRVAITREIAARDDRDRSREASPLHPADDAIRIDTTSMSLDEVLACATEFVQAAVSRAGKYA
ncbi:(d)CMP kinase [Terriglobus sp.]|uniref:(d)CMP kinase n=1 Tax=Terriglobus sp. TaxID=1889013 RepID=UPI003B0022E9